jgi:hypothetical protein
LATQNWFAEPSAGEHSPPVSEVMSVVEPVVPVDGSDVDESVIPVVCPLGTHIFDAQTRPGSQVPPSMQAHPSEPSSQSEVSLVEFVSAGPPLQANPTSEPVARTAPHSDVDQRIPRSISDIPAPDNLRRRATFMRATLHQARRALSSAHKAVPKNEAL